MILDVYLGNFYGIQKIQGFYHPYLRQIRGPFGRVGGGGGGAGGGEHAEISVGVHPSRLIPQPLLTQAGTASRAQN